MREINIINPAAGQGDAEKFAALDTLRKSYKTKFAGDAELLVYDECIKNPHTHFYIYGGDGTVNEAVNGIMSAGAQQSALISIIPVGTGNDLIRNFTGPKSIETLDVIKYNDRFAINMLNIGFDCEAAKRAGSLKTKPLISGSLAYLAGVTGALLGSFGSRLEITLEDQDGEVHTFSGEYLLCAIANCRYYGGGFCAAPAADYSDGLLDFVLVDKVSRTTFLRMVSDYKNGRHIDRETGKPTERFSDIMHSLKGRKISIAGLDSLCADGEVHSADTIEVSVLPQQIRILSGLSPSLSES